jgi:hypothetical protein
MIGRPGRLSAGRRPSHKRSAARRGEVISSAARACGIPTGRWAPRGWLTEAGPAPWLADWGLVECQDGESEAERFWARRRRCVRPT